MLGHLGAYWIPKNQCSVANSCPAKSRIILNGQRKSKKAKGRGPMYKQALILPFASAFCSDGGRYNEYCLNELAARRQAPQCQSVDS